MNQTLGEHKNVTLFNRFGVQLVGCGDKPYIQFTFEDKDDFGGTRMSVGRVQSTGKIVYARKRHSESVQSRDLHNIGSGHHRSHRIVNERRFCKTAEEKIGFRYRRIVLASKSVHLDSCKCVSYTDLLEKIRIGFSNAREGNNDEEICKKFGGHGDLTMKRSKKV